MATFSFSGRTRSGERVTGRRTAETLQEAVSALRREQIIVTRIAPAHGGGRRPGPRRRRGVKARSLTAFTRQLAVMIGAGLPLLECLDLLGTEEADRRLGRAIRDARFDVERGASLAEAMRRRPEAFDALYANMVAAGEAGGILETILDRLAAYTEKALKLRGQVVTAMMYPAAVVTMATLVVAVILWKVVPTFAELFAGLGADLPLPTRVVIGLSHGLVRWMPWLIAGIGAAGFALHRSYATERGRQVVDGWLLALPVIGSLLRRIAVARFCRTLGTLVGSGVPILEGLQVTASTCGNTVVQAALLAVRRGIERGESLAGPLRQSAVFPPMVVQMIAVGEATGALDTMLLKVADFYEQEVDAAIAGVMALLEPLMVGFLGVVVGGIVVAMYLPMFDLIGKLSP